jgi:hypothetical protein
LVSFVSFKRLDQLHSTVFSRRSSNDVELCFDFVPCAKRKGQAKSESFFSSPLSTHAHQDVELWFLARAIQSYKNDLRTLREVVGSHKTSQCAKDLSVRTRPLSAQKTS